MSTEIVIETKIRGTEIKFIAEFDKTSSTKPDAFWAETYFGRVFKLTEDEEKSLCHAATQQYIDTEQQ